jgi:hypothetical protein
MQLDKVHEHRFVVRVFKESMEVLTELHGSKTPPFDRNEDPLPNVHQYYILQVGNRIRNLVIWCRQLDQMVQYISNFSVSNTMKRKGVTRHTYLAYHIENYIIRVASIYDRVLQLIDTVFHLCNDPQNCTNDVILNNLKVKRTDVPSALRPLKKLLKEYRFPRNSIVHFEPYEDKLLRRLELYSHFNKDSPELDASIAKNIPFIQREAANDLIREKKKEFALLNKSIASALSLFLNKLEAHYEINEKRLRE